MNPISRREFVRAGKSAVAAAALGGCVKRRHDPFDLPRPDLPGTRGHLRNAEKWVGSVCGQCAAGCGIKVRVIEGRAVKIEGNPDHPLNRGSLGPKGQSGLEVLYHPDRIRGPLRRDGARGSNRWRQITWAEAIAEIGKMLRDLRGQGDPQSLVVLDGDPRGMTSDLWRRFLDAYGSPNHVNHRAMTDGGMVLAARYMHGGEDLPAYDWPGAKYVLGLGTNLFESWCQTIHLTRARSHLRHGISGQRVKFVQVSPRFSTTAGKADEFIAIEPATYGALALGLAHVLVRDKLFDDAFVRDHTFGFEAWTDKGGRKHKGFRDLVMNGYPPDKVAALTGVPIRTIERIAREMAASRPALAVADGSAAAATNGLGTAMAIHALNGLLGNLERRGGMLVQQRAPLATWPAVAEDEAALAGLGMPRLDGAGTPACPLGAGCIQGLPDAILSGKPYHTKGLFLHRSNPVFAKPDGRRWIEALNKVPLVVSFSPLRDESTFWADFVLPDHTYFERWEVVEPAPALGTPVLGLRQPVVRPVHDTMQTGEVVIKLGQAMGGGMAAAFPWKDYKEAAAVRLQGLASVEGASVKGADAAEITDAMAEAGGWWKQGYPFEAWDTAFATPSGRFEFYSQTLAARLAVAFPDPEVLAGTLGARGVATPPDELPLPHFEPARFAGDAKEFPFVLLPYRAIDYAEGGVRHIPWLVQLPLADGNPWHDRVELNPDDARALGIGDRTPVWIESPAGQRRLEAHVNPGARPGTVGLPLGHGAWPPRPDAPEPTGGYGLLVNSSDPLAGIFALQGTRVRIRRAST